ncbi:MAG: hypothetical protein HY582_03430, partial [Candidatus Omnitrophica bacterium]|nr:hypothetical protein [Candidatus Omnitrophota bacterium]
RTYMNGESRQFLDEIQKMYLDAKQEVEKVQVQVHLNEVGGSFPALVTLVHNTDGSFSLLLSTIPTRSELRADEKYLSFGSPDPFKAPSLFGFVAALNLIDGSSSTEFPSTTVKIAARLKYLLAKSPKERLEFLNSYHRLFLKHFSAVEAKEREYPAYAPAAQQIRLFKNLVARLLENLSSETHPTSYPSQELFGAFFIKLFFPDAWEEEITRLLHEIPALTERVPHRKLMRAIDESVTRLLSLAKVSSHEEDQVIQELRHQLYRELLHRTKVTPRKVEIGLNTSRDGQQSNASLKMSGEDQRRIIDMQVDLGTIRQLETWGGAVVQAALLEAKRGTEPEDPWYNLSAQTALLREKLEKVAAPFRGFIRQADWNLLFDRYRISEDRRILSQNELSELLKRFEKFMDLETRNEINRIYRMSQEMLLRGQYIVGLDAYPDSVLELFVRTAYKNGIDIFRIFDAFNDTRKIIPAIQYARKIGAKVQPVIHYTTEFPGGIPQYVALATELVKTSGSDLDALVIKDAGGLLEADEAFDLVRALRKSGLKVPILLHTHDIRGNRQITLLEAIRANGSQYPIIVDLGVGKDYLSSPFGQPDLHDFLDLIEGTPWQNDIRVDRGKLADLERAIGKEIIPKYLRLSITSKDRRDIVRARLPGGMKTNFIDDQIQKALKGSSDQLIKPTYGIDIFDKSGKFTENGQRFVDALLVLIYEEMRVVTRDLGGISLVTPTAQWIGTQAFQNVMGWLSNRWLRSEKGENTFALVQNNEFPREDRVRQYQLGPNFNLHPQLQNYLITWSQDAYLQHLYPNVNRDLVLKVFEGLQDPTIDLDTIQVSLKRSTVSRAGMARALGSYQTMRQAIGKPTVDLTVVKFTKKFRAQAKKEPQYQRALQNPNLLRKRRDLILSLASPYDPFLNIPLTLEELRKRFAIDLKKQNGIQNTDEDMLLTTLFPAASQAPYLFKQREASLRAIEEAKPEDRARLLKYHELRLRQMGMGVGFGLPISSVRSELREVAAFKEKFKSALIKDRELTEEEIKRYLGPVGLDLAKREGRQFFLRLLDREQGEKFIAAWRVEWESSLDRQASLKARGQFPHRVPYFPFFSDIQGLAYGLVSELNGVERLEGYMEILPSVFERSFGSAQSHKIKINIPRRELYFRNIGKEGILRGVRGQGVADLLFDYLIKFAVELKDIFVFEIESYTETHGSQSFARRRGLIHEEDNRAHFSHADLLREYHAKGFNRFFQNQQFVYRNTITGNGSQATLFQKLYQDSHPRRSELRRNRKAFDSLDSLNTISNEVHAELETISDRVMARYPEQTKIHSDRFNAFLASGEKIYESRGEGKPQNQEAKRGVVILPEVGDEFAEVIPAVIHAVFGKPVLIFARSIQQEEKIEGLIKRFFKDPRLLTQVRQNVKILRAMDVMKEAEFFLLEKFQVNEIRAVGLKGTSDERYLDRLLSILKEHTDKKIVVYSDMVENRDGFLGVFDLTENLISESRAAFQEAMMA